MNSQDILPISILTEYPTVNEGAIDSLLSEERKEFSRKIIVLDDDPTGVQTVHGVYVYTDWEESTIEAGFDAPESMFFLLTNSRGFTKEETIQVHTLIAERIGRIAKRRQQDFILLSRGDSTLRGHYPLETQCLADTLLRTADLITDGEILFPFFKEGGRFTLNNIHYVQDQDTLVPAGATEFAKDKSFGYTASHLGDYIEEKSQGAYLAKDCIYISLEMLRNIQLDVITDRLLHAENVSRIVVNAIDYIDVKIFCIAWIRAMKQGKHYIARTAAALPKIIGNIDSIPLLTKQDLITDQTQNGGIVMIGSYVQKTTAQLECLMQSNQDIVFLEFNVSAYFAAQGLNAEVTRILAQAENHISNGQTVVIYTSRQLLIPDSTDADRILEAYVQISDSLTNIIHLLSVKPRFILAKGGITSSDVGTKGLHVKKALVMGQIQKGIPVWMTGAESKFPHTPYIIFPGNVGQVDSLRLIVEELSVAFERSSFS
ncbi:MAG: four-carbon acid sugar kinase family protein [Lachnospiraceae bacterium]